jgi:16S rRNA (guanine527-N7)-methyltransferase
VTWPAADDLERRIAARARTSGLLLELPRVAALAEHARAVMEHNERLHLTAITDPQEFIERHLGESFEGAALLDTGIRGPLLDLGSGNGYPGIPLAIVREGLVPWLAEASTKRAAFLRGALRRVGLDPATVIERQVQRGADIEAIAPLRVITCRATGGWERILPRLARSLTADGRVLLWAGLEPERWLTREMWRRLVLVSRHPLPGRSQSFIWCFGPTAAVGSESD